VFLPDDQRRAEPDGVRAAGQHQHSVFVGGLQEFGTCGRVREIKGAHKAFAAGTMYAAELLRQLVDPFLQVSAGLGGIFYQPVLFDDFEVT
jgi:hypothetical protein